MRGLGLLVGVLSVCLQAQDAREIVTRSVGVTSLDSSLEREYTYRARAEMREPDKNGQLRLKEISVREVLYLNGKQYSHLVERDGKPLPAKEARKEQERLDKAVEEARKMTAADRAKRQAEAKKQREEDRETFKLIPLAYDFTLKGEPTVNGRRVWEIACTPRQSYRGKHDGLFKRIAGTLWIDQQDYHWVRVDAKTSDTISYGLVLARIAPGTRLFLELARVNNEVWLPARAEVAGSARVALFKKFHINQTVTFSDYKKYSADSKITNVSDLQP